MCTKPVRLGAALICLRAFMLPLAAAEDPSTVVIVVNDATAPEAGTGSVGASQFVGLHYAQARHVPLANILHVNIPGADPHAESSWLISQQTFSEGIATPLKHFLGGGNKHSIKYVVTTYGVPTHFAYSWGSAWAAESVDSWLSTVMLPAKTANSSVIGNPAFNSDPNSLPVHWASASNLSSPVYVVTRLDGPSAMLAAGLVDKAIAAEAGISRKSGNGYFDWQHRPLNYGDPYYPADQTMENAHALCTQARMTCTLNDQSQTGQFIYSAPRTLWAWGWYNTQIHAGYSFAPGAVGAQLTSYTANNIRVIQPYTWVPQWISQGITATWGATAEPGVGQYAKGDNLLQHLWNGYSFGEAAYIAQPYLNHVMVFIGDPLYRPLFMD